MELAFFGAVTSVAALFDFFREDVMKKIDYTMFLSLYANFGKIVKKSVIVIFLPLSFAYLIVLQTLTFVKQIMTCLFGYFNADAKDDPSGVRVAKTIVFCTVHIAEGFVLGALNVCTFIIGFFYDLTNKIMTLGKSDTYFVEL